MEKIFYTKAFKDLGLDGMKGRLWWVVKPNFQQTFWVYIFFPFFIVFILACFERPLPQPLHKLDDKVVLTIKTDNVTSCTKVDSHQQYSFGQFRGKWVKEAI